MRIDALARPSARAPQPRRSFLARLADAFYIARSRQALRHLDDHLLNDIGLSRDEAEAEARRPAWDAPSHWQG